MSLAQEILESVNEGRSSDDEEDAKHFKAQAAKWSKVSPEIIKLLKKVGFKYVNEYGRNEYLLEALNTRIDMTDILSFDLDSKGNLQFYSSRAIRGVNPKGMKFRNAEQVKDFLTRIGLQPYGTQYKPVKKK